VGWWAGGLVGWWVGGLVEKSGFFFKIKETVPYYMFFKIKETVPYYMLFKIKRLYRITCYLK